MQVKRQILKRPTVAGRRVAAIIALFRELLGVIALRSGDRGDAKLDDARRNQ